MRSYGTHSRRSFAAGFALAHGLEPRVHERRRRRRVVRPVEDVREEPELRDDEGDDEAASV